METTHNEKFKGEEGKRLAYIHFQVVGMYILGSILLLVLNMVWGDKNLKTPLIAGIASQVIPIQFLFRGNLRASSYSVIAIYIFFITLFATIGMGIRDYAIMIYPAAIVFSGMALKRRGLVFSTRLILIALTWLVCGDYLGWYATAAPVKPVPLDLLIALMIVVFTAMTVNSLVVNLESDHETTRRELARRIHTEEALALSEQRFKSYVSNAPNIITVIDGQYRIRYLNRTEFSLPQSMFLGSSIFDYISPEQHETVAAALQKARETDQACFYLTSTTVAGALQWYENNAARVDPANPESDIIIIISGNITERRLGEERLQRANEQIALQLAEIEQLQAELQEQAIRDPLTGVYNRRYMRDALKREFSRAAREQANLSVVMLDLDDLKAMNDGYGHRFGDEALKKLSACIQLSIRSEDIICRYAGDEFIVIMYGISTIDVKKRVEDWRATVNQDALMAESERVLIRFTAGIACYPHHTESLDELLNYADVALYRAKAEGRDRTMVFA